MQTAVQLLFRIYNHQLRLVYNLVNVVYYKTFEVVVFFECNIKGVGHGVDKVEFLIGNVAARKLQKTYYNNNLVVLFEGFINFVTYFQHFYRVSRISLALCAIGVFAHATALLFEIFVEKV